MHGFLLFNKPAGLSSAKALNPVRRALGRSIRVGHAGTLDPFATGLLLILLGDATRLSKYAGTLDKAYTATVLFGRMTDTLDPEGKVIETKDPGRCEPGEIASILQDFHGEIEQIPPAYSAIKLQGKRAYKLARAGAFPPLKPRKVRIHELAVTKFRWPMVSLRVVCSTGTYIRSLARDLGSAMHLPASLAALQRTRIGPFHVNQSIAMDCTQRTPLTQETIQTHLQNPTHLLDAAGMPLVVLSKSQAQSFTMGQAIRIAGRRHPGMGRSCGVLCRMAATSPPILVGIGNMPANHILKPAIVFAHITNMLAAQTDP